GGRRPRRLVRGTARRLHRTGDGRGRRAIGSSARQGARRVRGDHRLRHLHQGLHRGGRSGARVDRRRPIREDAARSVHRRREREPRRAHARWRAERDVLFGTHPQSALPDRERARFRGLAYHEYDPAFAFNVAVRPLPEERYDVPTSTGGVIPFVRFGAVDLPIGALEVFWLDAYGGGVFLPFRDATSGSSTYGGGRYLLDTA